MRTLEELTDLLNPERKKINKWMYIVVEKQQEMPSKRVETYLEIHEVYFDQTGNFIGITENPRIPQGDDLDDLIKGLGMMMKDAKANPIITWKEHQLIHGVVE